MYLWLEELVGPDYATAAYWAAMALAGLIILNLLLWFRRRFRSGTYVAGGRNRKQRLAIMDATAIDTHRRLVLVRRDDVEHLILIGGHTDIVVESNIRSLAAAPRKPAEAEQAVQAAKPQPTEPQKAVEQKPATAIAPAAPQPVAAAQPPAERRSFTQRVTSFSPRSSTRATAPAEATKPVPEARSAEEFDSDLVKELETALDVDQVPTGVRTRATLDDEMTKLLGELKNHKS